jgi:hypothetical protein
MGWEDPIVANVRQIREELSAQFGFDLPAIFADIRTRQFSVGERLVRLKHEHGVEQDKALVPPQAASKR